MGDSSPSPSHWDRWRRRLGELRARAGRAAPFGAGVLAAPLALALYNVALPAPPPLTVEQVRIAVGAAAAGDRAGGGGGL